VITLILRHRFIFQPVLLSSFIEPFDGLDRTFKLYDLVREYTPEEYNHLLKMQPVTAAVEFAKIFSKRYFPIDSNNTNYNPLIKRLTDDIPLDWHGFNPWNYEEFYRIGKAQLLAEVICVTPDHVTGSRVAVSEVFIENIKGVDEARSLVNKLPVYGCQLDDLEVILKDRYSGLLLWCHWLFNRTGNIWLDNDRQADWSRDLVDQLTRAWPLYLKMDSEMKSFDKWLSNDFSARSTEIIKFITGDLYKRLINNLKEEPNGKEDQ